MVARPSVSSIVMTPIGRGRGFASLNKNLRGGERCESGPQENKDAKAPKTTMTTKERQSSGGEAIAVITGRSPAQPPQPAQPAQPPQPPQTAQPAPPKNASFIDENAQSVLYVEDAHIPLIDQLEVLSDKDDGILTNQKILHIEGTIIQLSPQLDLLRAAMESLASAAILYATKAKKIAKLISYSRTPIHQQRLHGTFVAALRDKIDGLEISLDGADQCFVNASTVLTDIYSESKSPSPEELTALTHLIIQVSVGLLECNTTLSLRTLNAQLMLYGKDLYKIAPEKFDSVSLSVRKLIIARQPPVPSSRIWLALLSDQCLYRFEPLPQYLQNFYARQLDDSNHDAEPRDSRFASEPPIRAENYSSKLPQTLNDRQHENYEKRNSIKSDSSDRWSIASNGERKISQMSIHDQIRDDVFDKCFESELSFENSSYSECYPENNGQTYQERKMRPILGAGSRLQINKNDMKTLPNDHSMSYGGNESAAEIPRFCPNVPPPNFISNAKGNDNRKSAERFSTSVSQENADFWNYPPPKLPPANLNKKTDTASSMPSRLDLNTWRQQNSEPPSLAEPRRFDLNSWRQQKPNELESFDGHGLNSFPYDGSSDFTDGILESSMISHRNNTKHGMSKIETENLAEDNRNTREDVQYESNIWDKNKAEITQENDQNWRSNSKQPSDKKSIDPSKKETRSKRETDEKETNWKRRDSDESKNWDGKSESGDKKAGGRRDSRSKGTKKDMMEVSRKASYWTHDDRCDRDYDG